MTRLLLLCGLAWGAPTPQTPHWSVLVESHPAALERVLVLVSDPFGDAQPFAMPPCRWRLVVPTLEPHDQSRPPSH